MTIINFNDEGSKLYLKASGHATGSIEICAAVSTLMLGFTKYLIDWDEMHSIKKADGVIEIECKSSLQTLGAYEMVIGTLKQLALENPDYIKIGGGN